MPDIYFKIGYVLIGILGIFVILCVFFSIISDYRKGSKRKNSKKYLIQIYDLDGKIVMSFLGINVDGNDNTVFFETEDGKQTILYVPNNAIVTIEEV